jgi:hypothetical protein
VTADGAVGAMVAIAVGIAGIVALVTQITVWGSRQKTAKWVGLTARLVDECRRNERTIREWRAGIDGALVLPLDHVVLDAVRTTHDVPRMFGPALDFLDEATRYALLASGGSDTDICLAADTLQRARNMLKWRAMNMRSRTTVLTWCAGVLWFLCAYVLVGMGVGIGLVASLRPH